MTFIKWDTNRVPLKRSLRINRSNLHIGADVYKSMGSPGYIEVYYDLEAHAIKLVPDKRGRKVALNKGRAPHMSVRIYKVMPMGRYDMEDFGAHDNWIFKLSDAPQSTKEGTTDGGK